MSQVEYAANLFFQTVSEADLTPWERLLFRYKQLQIPKKESM